MPLTTLYNYYMIAREWCIDKASIYLEKGENNLYLFYFNAANGFAKKALSLNLNEASRPIWGTLFKDKL